MTIPLTSFLKLDINFRAVFCLLGGCDVKEDFADVVQTAEDYIWFKLGQVKTMVDTQELPMDMLTYNHLQSLISMEYGWL